MEGEKKITNSVGWCILMSFFVLVCADWLPRPLVLIGPLVKVVRLKPAFFISEPFSTSPKSTPSGLAVWN